MDKIIDDIEMENGSITTICKVIAINP